MTIREKMKERLVKNALWPNEADAIIDNATYDESLKSMGGRWNETIEGYPPQLLSTVWASIKFIAIEWINKNKPMHIARLMLEQS